MAKINFQLTRGDHSASLVYEDKAEWTPEGVCKVIETIKASFGQSCTCHHKGASEPLPMPMTHDEIPPLPNEHQQKQDGTEHFNIRKRLPNNIVDVSDLTIQQATTNEALIRCPICGQAHAVIVSDNINLYLMRKSYATDEFGIVKSSPGTEQGSILGLSRQCNLDHENDAHDKLDFFYLVQSMPLTENKDFAVTNDTELFCPVCHQSAPFIHWKQAWHEPSRFFEHMHICEACGGECVEKIDSDKDKTCILVCDACGKTWLNKEAIAAKE